MVAPIAVAWQGEAWIVEAVAALAAQAGIAVSQEHGLSVEVSADAGGVVLVSGEKRLALGGAPLSAVEALVAMERWLGGDEGANLELGKGVWLDMARQSLHDGVHSVDLTENELEMLVVLHRTGGISREAMLAEVWGMDAARIETTTVDTHLYRLRKKLRDEGFELQLVSNQGQVRLEI